MTRRPSARIHAPHVVRKPSAPPRPRRLSTLALRAVGLCALALVLADPAAASGGATMPWDGPLQQIADALTGNTVRIVAVIALAAGGIIWAFTRNEEGVKRIGQAVLGLGIAIGATSFAATLGISGASF